MMILPVLALFLLMSEDVYALDNCRLDQLKSIEDIKRLIENPECKINSKEAFIKSLPENFKKNPVLVYRSQSLQGPHKTDYLNPRALLFENSDSNNNAPEYQDASKSNLILSFNGNPKDDGFKSIEIFDDKSKKMFELTFDSNKAAISDETNGKCLRCHGNPPRPIFHSYPDWDGVFGSQHLGSVPPEEEEGFNDFLKKSNQNPNSIYSLLKFTYKNDGSSINEAAENNINFNGKLNGIHFRNSISNNQKLKDSNFKYAVAGALKQCNNFFDFFPANVKNEFLKKISTKYDFNKNWTKNKISDFDKEIDTSPRLFRLQKDFDSYTNYLKDNEQFKPYLFDTFKRQGLQSATLSGAFLRFIFEGQDDNLAFVDLMPNQFRTSALFTEAEIANEFLGKDLSCNELKNLSLKSLTDIKQEKECNNLTTNPYEDISSQISVFKIPIDKMKEKRPIELFQHYCIQCHGDKNQKFPPLLPLDDEQKLKNYKAQSKVELLYRLENNIMPPPNANHQLPDEDRLIMIKFFEKK